MCTMARAADSLQEQGISWGRKGEDQVHHRCARTILDRTTVIPGQKTDFPRWHRAEQPSPKGMPAASQGLVPLEDQYNVKAKPSFPRA